MRIFIVLMSFFLMMFGWVKVATAAVDAAASAVVTQITTDAGTVAGYGWSILAAIFGGLIIMGVFKAYARKGAGR